MASERMFTLKLKYLDKEMTFPFDDQDKHSLLTLLNDVFNELKVKCKFVDITWGNDMKIKNKDDLPFVFDMCKFDGVIALNIIEKHVEGEFDGTECPVVNVDDLNESRNKTGSKKHYISYAKIWEDFFRQDKQDNGRVNRGTGSSWGIRGREGRVSLRGRGSRWRGRPRRSSGMEYFIPEIGTNREHGHSIDLEPESSNSHTEHINLTQTLT
ncbi:hypothetical protein JCGZ_19298 [Jatropha curcas]|uniref:Uncharacterized protein n=1 Tax=Jatropha curcas TaxID=180498 RepID=A0A067KC94_JATCU|nr:hypothetical protein JCGZ_19298 [Jatropha curcas]